MYYLTEGARGANGRMDEHAIMPAADTARILSTCPGLDGEAVAECVPFGMLRESMEHDSAHNGSSAHARRIAAAKRALRSTREHIYQSTIQIAVIHDSVARTRQIIRDSQQLIYLSDLAIARTTMLDCK